MVLSKNLIVLILLACPLAIFAASAVDINAASLKELDTLAGIGPVLAQRIIDNRPYYTLEDLLQVKGIGPATLQKIQEQGLAYVSSLPKPEKSATKQSIQAAPAALQESPGLPTDSLHPLWLFVAIAGLILTAGSAYLLWKFKLYK